MDRPSPLLVGVDVGGTKTHVRVQRDATVLVDHIAPSKSWRPNLSIASPESAAGLWQCIEDALIRAAAEGNAAHAPASRSGHSAAPSSNGASSPTALQPDALVVGAHGIDTRQDALALEQTLASRTSAPVRVVNDAVLLGPASGSSGTTLAMIVGTGAIVVASNPQGVLGARGGHGFLLGDEGSAPALVRDLVRGLLAAEDEARPDLIALSHLADSVGLPPGEEREEELARWLHENPTMEAWGAHAPAVFAAADAGSAIASMVIRDHAHALARLVELHLTSGVTPESLVISGGVATHQPRLVAEIERRLVKAHPDLPIIVLDDVPVAGAIALARALVDGRS